MPAAERTREATEVRDLLASAVREGGKLALAKFRTEFKSWTKGKSSPVSEVDVAVDDLLRERLRAAAPDYGWLSEETADDPSRVNVRRVWIVDPIDGTRGFIAGLTDWTVVAALVEDGRPIAAAVFAPALSAMFTAALGAGSCRNDVPIAPSTGASIDGMRIAGPKRYVDVLAAAAERVEVVPRINSLAYRFARVAEGTLDVALSGGASRDWDLAAVDLLVHEAGGALTSLGGRPPAYNRPDPVHGALIAAGRDRHASLIAYMRDHQAAFV